MYISARLQLNGDCTLKYNLSQLTSGTKKSTKTLKYP